ncbi:MAG TPA: hypothetical protein VE615_05370 [Gaiellaceae bacterium]|jgi:hypothetical protein|nr:hypothetical protein [Gaiellaceae bacterium]
MSREPDFRELVGDGLSPEEEARLRRAHELLLAAGPPPELPGVLAQPPTPQARIISLAQKRVRTGLVLAAAIVLAAFALGYFVGARDDGSSLGAGFAPEETAVLGKSGGRLAVVRIGGRDDNGNRPMLVTVEKLKPLPSGDYYTLFMTRKGKPIVVCGTFNVEDEDTTNVRFSVAYDPDHFDGLMLARYDGSTHDDVPLLRAPLT